MGSSSDCPDGANGPDGAPLGDRRVIAGLTVDDERRGFLAGLAHFNAGEFYEAHDAWEGVWSELEGRRALFYQALIQTAVMFVLMQNGQAAGVRAVYASVREKLARLPERHRGVDLGRLSHDVERAASWIVERPPGEWRKLARRSPSGEAMLFDPERAFEIRLAYDPFAETHPGDD